MKKFVKNVPNYAWEDKNQFWVVTEDNGELWFYGAYQTRQRAVEVALELHKMVVAD